MVARRCEGTRNMVVNELPQAKRGDRVPFNMKLSQKPGCIRHCVGRTLLRLSPFLCCDSLSCAILQSRGVQIRGGQLVRFGGITTHMIRFVGEGHSRILQPYGETTYNRARCRREAQRILNTYERRNKAEPLTATQLTHITWHWDRTLIWLSLTSRPS